MKKISILGVSITERSVEESLALTDSYLESGALNTILYVSAKMLLAAGENPEQKEWIESMDLTLCTESDILRAVNMATVSRISEVENHAYFKEFLHRLSVREKSVYLLTEKERDMVRLKDSLAKTGMKLNIVSENSLEAMAEDMERLVNHMNDVAANVIISMIPFTKQEKIMAQNKNYVNSEVWLALPMQEETYPKERIHFLKWTLQRLHFGKFKRRVMHYNEAIETE